MGYKLQLWSTDDNGLPSSLEDEVDVDEDEFSYAQEDGGAATLLLGNLQIGRMV